MSTSVTFAHVITAQYLPPTDTQPARWSLSWPGWPSDDSRPVRRRIAWCGPDQLAQAAAAMLGNWLSAAPGDAIRRPMSPAVITIGRGSADRYMILVHYTTAEA